MQGQKCMICGREPDSVGTVHHSPECSLPAFAGQLRSSVPPPEIEHSPFFADGAKATETIERRIRAICKEEISIEIALLRDAARLMSGAAKTCVECERLKLKLALAKIALRKIADMDPVFAGQRAQMNMPVEHDIAKLTLREIETDHDVG